MSLLRQFLQDQMPPIQRVGGIKLHRYCLGHDFLLRALGNPLVWEPASKAEAAQRPPVAKGDCLFALWILSRPATVAIRDVEKRRVIWWMRWAGYRLRHIETNTLAAQLRSFIIRGSRGPKWKPKHKPSLLSPGTPLILCLKRNQMTAWHRTEAEALNNPLGAVKWEYCAWLEQEGDLTIQETDNLKDAFKAMFPRMRPINAEEFAILKRGGNPWAKGAPDPSPVQTAPAPAEATQSPAARSKQETL